MQTLISILVPFTCIVSFCGYLLWVLALTAGIYFDVPKSGISLITAFCLDLFIGFSILCARRLFLYTLVSHAIHGGINK